MSIVKQNKKSLKKVKIFSLVFIIILLLAFILFPIISKSLIKSVIKNDLGFQVEKLEKFSPSPFLNSLNVKNVELNIDDYLFFNGQRLSLSRLKFKGINLYSFYKFMKKGELKQTLTLIKDLKVDNLQVQDLNNNNFNFNLGLLQINTLTVQPEGETESLLKLKNKWPVFFNSAEAKNIHYSTPNNTFKANLNALDVYNFKEDKIISFNLNGLEIINEGQPIIELADLKVVNLNLNYIQNISGSNFSKIIWLLQSAKFINLNSFKIDVSYINNLFDYLYISEVKFDENRTANNVSFSRIIKDLRIGVLNSELKGEYEEFWETFKEELNLELNFEATFNEAEKIFKINNLAVNSANLFEFNLNLTLNEVSPLEKNINKLFLLISSAAWVPKEGGIFYKDNGFFQEPFYQLLKECCYKDLNSLEIKKRFKEDLNLFFKTIAEEEVIENIQLIEKELFIFLEEPKQFKINIQPSKDYALGSFAIYDKYGIINALNLSIQINERAPIFIVVNKNAQSTNIPTFPQPMEKLFQTN